MKLLFVCTGNTCRSPLAEAIARKVAIERGLLDIEVVERRHERMGRRVRLGRRAARRHGAPSRSQRRIARASSRAPSSPTVISSSRWGRTISSASRRSAARGKAFLLTAYPDAGLGGRADQRSDGRRARGVSRHRRRARDRGAARLRPPRRGARSRRIVRPLPGRLVLLGHPVAHSLSPRFQNAALRAAGIPLVYEALDVAPEALAATLAELAPSSASRATSRFRTRKPSPRAVHRLTPLAERCGAVNTFWHEDGRARRRQHRRRRRRRDRVGALLGAARSHGDASRCSARAGSAAAVVAAVERWGGARVRLYNRDMDRARALAARFGAVVEVVDSVEQALDGATLVVNATPIGLTRRCAARAGRSASRRRRRVRSRLSRRTRRRGCAPRARRGIARPTARGCSSSRARSRSSAGSASSPTATRCGARCTEPARRAAASRRHRRCSTCCSRAAAPSAGAPRAGARARARLRRVLAARAASCRVRAASDAGIRVDVRRPSGALCVVRAAPAVRARRPLGVRAARRDGGVDRPRPQVRGWSAVAAPMARRMARAALPARRRAERAALVPVPLAPARRARARLQPERGARRRSRSPVEHSRCARIFLHGRVRRRRRRG